MKGYMLRLKEAQMRHADEIAQIEAEVNHQMGGDCGISELVALMLTRGWQPPNHCGTETALDYVPST